MMEEQFASHQKITDFLFYNNDYTKSKYLISQQPVPYIRNNFQKQMSYIQNVSLRGGGGGQGANRVQNINTQLIIQDIFSTCKKELQKLQDNQANNLQEVLVNNLMLTDLFIKTQKKNDQQQADLIEIQQYLINFLNKNKNNESQIIVLLLLELLGLISSIYIMNYQDKDYKSKFLGILMDLNMLFDSKELTDQYNTIKPAIQTAFLKQEMEFMKLYFRYKPDIDQIRKQKSDKSINELIREINNVEIQINISEQIQFDKYSSIMIYKLHYYFQMLKWQVYFEKKKEEMLNKIYQEAICKSKSFHTYHQWIRLLSDLQIIRPVLQIDESTFQNQQILRIVQDYNLVLFQNAYNNILEDLNKKVSFKEGYKLLLYIRQQNYFQKKKYLVWNGSEKDKTEEILNTINFCLKSQNIILPLRNHIMYLEKENEDFLKSNQPLEDDAIEKLKNNFKIIIIDCIKILIELNKLQNMHFHSTNSQSKQELFKIKEVLEKNLFNKWKEMMRIVYEKMKQSIVQKNGQDLDKLKINLKENDLSYEQIEESKQQIDADVVFKQYVIESLKYQNKLLNIIKEILSDADSQINKSEGNKEQKAQYACLIIFTIELMRDLNKIYLNNLIILYMQLLNNTSSNQCQRLKQQFRVLMKQAKNYDNLLSKACTKKENQITIMQEKLNQNKDLFQNEDQKQVYKHLEFDQWMTEFSQMQLNEITDPQNKNKFIVSISKSFQYPIQLNLSEHKRRLNEDLAFQLIKILTLCNEQHVFEYALELLLYIWFNHINNKLSLSDNTIQKKVSQEFRSKSLETLM